MFQKRLEKVLSGLFRLAASNAVAAASFFGLSTLPFAAPVNVLVGIGLILVVGANNAIGVNEVMEGLFGEVEGK
jgi:hypothetical protein